MTLIIPYSFTPGEKANAVQVNANFTAVTEELNEFESNIGTSVSNKANINGDASRTFSVASPINGTDAINKSYLESHLPGGYVGQIVTSLSPLNEAGLKELDGSLLTYTGVYKDVIDKYAALYESGTCPGIFVTQATWDSINQTYDKCGKFVYDSDAKTLRLPNLNGFVEYTTTISEIGELTQAGLPNITGYFGGTANYNQSTSGAFYKGTTKKQMAANSGDTDDYDIYINASRSSSIYGNSSTVQPESIKTYCYIVLATVLKQQAELDVDAIMSELNQKADKDLTNCTRPYITETYVNGTSWYRVWSDKWCEQGGVVATNSGATNLSFLKEFDSIYYYVNVSRRAQSSTTTDYTIFTRGKDTDGCQLYSSGSSSYDWYACGFIK